MGNDEGPVSKKRRACTDSQENEPTAASDNKETMRRNGKQVPKFRLKPSGENASLATAPQNRVPLMLTDIQHLLLHSLLGNLNLAQPPRWYTIDKCGKVSQTTCIILEGVSVQHWQKYSNNENSGIIHLCENTVEILTPSIYNGSLVQELALVPLSEVEKEIIIQKYGSMNLALEARKDLMVMMRAVFPIQNDISDTELSTKDKFPRTQLILSAWQLIEENYPVPLKGKLQVAYSDYKMTKVEYKPVTAQSPMFGLDCEMCMTNAGSELTRVSVVNEKHETIYEALVKPYNDITDYLTKFSGITKKILSNVTKRLEDVQNDLIEILPPDAILVGQSLNIDLHALKLMHPYVIDTSLIFNFTGERTRKPKLKTLAKELLQIDIQSSKSGHCSVEDSITSLKLVQLKLSKSLEYGDAVHTNRKQYKENVIRKLEKTPHIALTIFNHMIEQKKSSLVIGCDDITGDYHTYLTQAKDSLSAQFKKGKPKKVKLSTVDEPEEVITTLCKAVHEYNFVMAHLKMNINEDNEKNQMDEINKWINTIWDNALQSSLCVVVFSGTTTDNGVGMIKVKHTV